MHNQIEAVLSYFLKDPLKILYLIGGTGGIWYWISQWRDRIRIQVRIRQETFDVKENPNLEIRAEYEIENIGTKPTSLDSKILISGYTPKGVYQQVSIEIDDLERGLQPFKPQLFRVMFVIPASYPFLLFRKYTFTLTRGKGKHLRVWSASKRNISFFRFHFELLRFRVFSIYEEPGT